MTTPRSFPHPGYLIQAILLRDEPAVADTGSLQAPIYHVSTRRELPVKLDGPQLPYVRVLAGSGGRDEITDRAFVDVEVWDDIDTGNGYALAERIADQHIRKRAAAAGLGVLDYVRISIRPQDVEWGDNNVSRHLVQFQVSTRRTGG